MDSHKSHKCKIIIKDILLYSFFLYNKKVFSKNKINNKSNIYYRHLLYTNIFRWKNKKKERKMLNFFSVNNFILINIISRNKINVDIHDKIKERQKVKQK
ncbi:hypothetical protein PFFVO_02504 [Plasmodium falciparum Vietnam Oak-Knoll (FVO)]|uniref:Uncharacterized protein n=1 Tax=Plasmodium falciparum Vietnam Oak-Knoll (FVO) TaxID=1036723 RepID=A0A024V7R9_PLAFA|nr:hypothetical protein PFFVO_02504 [Plasmodium falciparum Vietnam Oak-Knoll (FVO)]